MSDSNQSLKGTIMHVVSHTHWDREWYQDFQAFRTRLVYMMDELLETLEHNPDYHHFLLDGQTIVLDDYLEIRPENRERLSALIKAGKIAIGPWYVMPDEFLVSGESLVRNLLKGVRATQSWGVEPLRSGYITDIFGHNSQMPQILRGFGLDNAVLFRGFHGDGDPAEAWWQGADGSRVLMLRLDEDRAYGDFYFFIRWPFANRQHQYEPEELIQRARSMLAYKRKRTTTDVLLGLDGVDHIEIEPNLPWILKTLNEADLDARFVHSTLNDYLALLSSRVSDLRTYHGEIRSPGHRGLNNWLLANVLSSRVHLKQYNHTCETLLESWAEPWAVFAAWQGRPYPQSFLANAWTFLLQNHPHDSICGCSVDQVHKDMIYRFDQARLIAEHMTNEELSFIAHHINPVATGGDQTLLVFNPLQRMLDTTVEIEIALSAGSDAAVKMPLIGGTSFRMYDVEGAEVPYQVLGIRPNSVRRTRPYRDLPGDERVDRIKIAFQAQVPAFGYATYRVVPFEIAVPETGEYTSEKFRPPVRYPGSMRTAINTWDNGCLQLHIAQDGTLSLTDHATGHTFSQPLIFEDDADIGDGWNHIAPVTNEAVTSLGTPFEVSVLHDGPLLTRLRVALNLRVPASIHPNETRRSDARVTLPIVTYIDLRASDPMLRCRTVVSNTARDHRLRLLVPTYLESNTFRTSTPFDITERPIPRPDYTDHIEVARFVVPTNGLIAIDNEKVGMALYSQGLYECALSDDTSRAIALTLLRSTHKEVMTDGGDGGQLLGESIFEFALRPFDPHACAPNTLWLESRHFLAGERVVDVHQGRVAHGTPHQREADLPLSNSFLRVESESLVVTAIKLSENYPDRYIIRLVNISKQSSSGSLHFDRTLSSISEVSLDEQPLRQLQVDGASLKLEVRPKQILTLEVVC